MTVFRFLPFFLVVSFLLSGCIPYAVGNTAATVPEGEVDPSGGIQFVSDRRNMEETPDTPPGERGGAVAIYNEARLGLDAWSDVGVRLVGAGGAVASYKRRLLGSPGSETGLSVIAGAGIVEATHVHWEATVVASGYEMGPVLPYGGIRTQGLTPFSSDAASVPVALGGFVGGRIGWNDLSISPEVGVFYQPSEFFGDPDVIVVPSITIRGERLRRALGL